MNGSPPPTLPASVIIPSRDRPQLVLECVKSILGGNEVPRELIVIDQSASENRALAEMGTVNGCAVLYRRSSAIGVSAARNEACALASQDVFVFADDDVVVDPDWLGVMVGEVRDEPEAAILSGRVLVVDSDAAGGFAPSVIEDEQPATYAGRIWDDVLYSNNMAFARAIFDRLGPFDVRLGIGSPYRAATDNDYGFRALEAGYRIRYVPDAVVYHQAWRPEKNYPRVQWAYGVGQGAFLTKYIRRGDLYTLIRLRREFTRASRRLLQILVGDRRVALDEAARLAGLTYGSLRWALMERLRGR